VLESPKKIHELIVCLHGFIKYTHKSQGGMHLATQDVHLLNYFCLKVLYAPHPGLKPVSNLPLPKTSRLSTVTTVLDNLRKFSNYSIQVAAFTAAGDGKFSNIITCASHIDGKKWKKIFQFIVQNE
jgi:hypothetical protein